MKSALIGYTGFVGGNIATQHSFNDLYNTKNIDNIDGREYDLVVSAATYAEMWRINQDPEGDLAQIHGLIRHLKNVKTKQFILISTVGVYKDPNGEDEDTVIDTRGLSPYGKHRYMLEQFVAENFNSLIIRLPGLFGKGLKKNAIYDLLNQNMVEKLHSKSQYQYYNLDNIWRDIVTALDKGLNLVNFATEPVTNKEVAEKCFSLHDFNQQPANTEPAHWDMHTKNAIFFSAAPPYLYDKKQVLADIKNFVEGFGK
jgi:nucleoside-diphosphate-sugar epimerase